MLVSRRRCSGGGDVHVACDMLMIYWYLMFDLKPFSLCLADRRQARSDTFSLHNLARFWCTNFTHCVPQLPEGCTRGWCIGS